MSYLPLARKYRPQTFEDLVGQPHVTTTITRALAAKRIAQAYLFAGMRGVGKTSAARILAKCLNCESGPTPTPCNRCSACTQITQGSSLDVIEIDGASNRGIDEIRSLRETVPFAPAVGAFRVYIIDEVHMLTTEAFNALLKTLEEPPAHVKFIFATTAPQKVPATILSRCQRFDFRRIESGTLVPALARIAKAEKIPVNEPALYAVARASEGSLRDAEVVLEQLASFVQGPIEETHVTELLGAIEAEALLAWVQAIMDRKTTQALEMLQRQSEQGKDATQLLGGLVRHLRNLLLLRGTQEEAGRQELLVRLIDEPADRMARLEQQASRLGVQELLFMVQIASGAAELIRRSPMAQTILELTVIKLATREAWQSLDEISRRLEGVRESPAASPARAQAPAVSDPTVKPAQSAAPVAERSASSPTALIPDTLAAMWSQFLDRLASQKMSLAAYLAEAKPVALENGLLIIGLPGFALHQEVLSVVENRRLITGLLSELAHMAVTVQYTTLPESGQPEAASRPAPAAPPVVQDIVNLFNATLLDRPSTT